MFLRGNSKSWYSLLKFTKNIFNTKKYLKMVVFRCHFVFKDSLAIVYKIHTILRSSLLSCKSLLKKKFLSIERDWLVTFNSYLIIYFSKLRLNTCGIGLLQDFEYILSRILYQNALWQDWKHCWYYLNLGKFQPWIW